MVFEGTSMGSLSGHWQEELAMVERPPDAHPPKTFFWLVLLNIVL